MTDQPVEIFLLTVKSRDDHALNDKIAAISAGLGHVELINGFDGSSLPAIEYFSHMIDIYSKNRQILSPSEIGCALSHRKIMDVFLKGSARVAIIFEDDVQFHDTAFDLLKECLRLVGPADTLVAGCQDGFEEIPLFGFPLCNDLGLFEVHKSSWREVQTRCAYAVGRKAAEHICRMQKEILWLADDYEMLCHPAGRLLFSNAPFSHPGTVSRIQPEREIKLKIGPGKPLIKRISREIQLSLATRKRRLFHMLLTAGLLKTIDK